MCEEEKAATLARPLTSLEDLFAIELRGEASLEHLQANIIRFEQFSELVQLVVCDLCLRIYSSNLLLFAHLADLALLLKWSCYVHRHVVNAVKTN